MDEIFMQEREYQSRDPDIEYLDWLYQTQLPKYEEIDKQNIKQIVNKPLKNN